MDVFADEPTPVIPGAGRSSIHQTSIEVWYYQALANPHIEVTVEGVRAAHAAVPLQTTEHDEPSRVYEMGFVLRLMCAFAPSKFLRLDPVN